MDLLDKKLMEIVNSIAELRASQKQTDRQMQATDKRLEKMRIMLGGVANNQGDVAEEFFYNSLKTTLKLGNITYDYIDKNLTRSYNKVEAEFDLILVNGKEVAIIETKYKSHTNDIKQLLDIKYPSFKKLFPKYKNYKHRLFLASFHINESVKQQALSQGVSIIQRNGDTIETIAA